ncbi:MAG: hypothetical protein ACPIOQ_20470 [Promethearchaeia archaeon]
MVRAEDALERAGSLVADSLPISRPKAQDGASKADEEIGKGLYETAEVGSTRSLVSAAGLACFTQTDP